MAGALPDSTAGLRRGLLATVRDRGGEITESVAEALLAVPRHLFVPEVSPERAYGDEAIVTKRDADGVPISSSSQPTIMALMLDQLGLAPGHRVLEIGAGTGYNAALMAHLVGPSGTVVSVDIDPEVAQRARENLAAAGYPDVTVVCADGAEGYAEAAPYDRIIATVGVWDLAPAWLDQLASLGRVVVPLALRGAQLSVAFEWDDGRWVSRSLIPCGFMRMRGQLGGPEQTRVLDRELGLMLSLPDSRNVDADGVRAALDGPKVVRATEVTGDGVAHLDGVMLWLAMREPRACALSDQDGPSAALEEALVRVPGFRTAPGIVDGADIALLGSRDLGEGSFELQVQGYGPGGERLATDLAAHIGAWDQAGRPSSRSMSLVAYARDANMPRLDDEIVVDKTHTRIVVRR